MRILWLLIVFLCASLQGCVTDDTSRVDVTSTRYLAFDKTDTSKGSVFVFTESYANQAYPSESERSVISIVESRMKALGYSIESNNPDADFTFMLHWGIEGGDVVGYNMSDSHASARRLFVHASDGILIRKGPNQDYGDDLWKGRASEVWGHAQIDPEKLTRLLMEKFPN